VYFNVDHVRDALSALLNERPDPPQLVILFMGNVPHVDLAGAELLIALRRFCLGRGIEFRLAETHGQVREALLRLDSPHASSLAEANQTVDNILNQTPRRPA
jgi:MFS superfamily sulfate permease-like transporter